MFSRASWYSEGLRWIGTLFEDAADFLERSPGREPLEPMPRHTSYEEVVSELRNRMQAGFGGGQRPPY